MADIVLLCVPLRTGYSVGLWLGARSPCLPICRVLRSSWVTCLVYFLLTLEPAPREPATKRTRQTHWRGRCGVPSSSRRCNGPRVSRQLWMVCRLRGLTSGDSPRPQFSSDRSQMGFIRALAISRLIFTRDRSHILQGSLTTDSAKLTRWSRVCSQLMWWLCPVYVGE